MQHHGFASLRHGAGTGLDRRASVKALGAAGILSALAAPLSGAAKKGGRCHAKCQKTCARQNDACATFASDACTKLFPADPGCEDRFADCCASLYSGRACLQTSDRAADHTCVGYRCILFYSSKLERRLRPGAPREPPWCAVPLEPARTGRRSA